MIEEKLADIRQYLTSGQMELDFCKAGEERKGELLDFLEALMETAELADEIATRIIFKDSNLEALAGIKS